MDFGSFLRKRQGQYSDSSSSIDEGHMFNPDTMTMPGSEHYPTNLDEPFAMSSATQDSNGFGGTRPQLSHQQEFYNTVEGVEESGEFFNQNDQYRGFPRRGQGKNPFNNGRSQEDGPRGRDKGRRGRGRGSAEDGHWGIGIADHDDGHWGRGRGSPDDGYLGRGRGSVGAGPHSYWGRGAEPPFGRRGEGSFSFRNRGHSLEGQNQGPPFKSKGYEEYITNAAVQPSEFYESSNGGTQFSSTEYKTVPESEPMQVYETEKKNFPETENIASESEKRVPEAKNIASEAEKKVLEAENNVPETMKNIPEAEERMESADDDHVDDGGKNVSRGVMETLLYLRASYKESENQSEYSNQGDIHTTSSTEAEKQDEAIGNSVKISDSDKNSTASKKETGANEEEEEDDESDEEEDETSKVLKKLPRNHNRGVMSTLISLLGSEALDRKPDPLPPPQPMKLEDETEKYLGPSKKQELTERELRMFEKEGISKAMLDEANAVVDSDDLDLDQFEATSSHFYCKLCKLQANSMVSFRTHLNGKKHQANVEALNAGKPLTGIGNGGKKSKGAIIMLGMNFGKSSLVMEIMDTIKDQAVVGLSYITEFHSLCSGIACVCNLCGVRFDKNIAVSHTVGIKHRMHYLREHEPVHYVHAKKYGGKRSKLSAMLEEICQDVEAKNGRGTVQIKVFSRPEADTDANTETTESLDPSSNLDDERIAFLDWVVKQMEFGKVKGGDDDDVESVKGGGKYGTDSGKRSRELSDFLRRPDQHVPFPNDDSAADPYVRNRDGPASRHYGQERSERKERYPPDVDYPPEGRDYPPLDSGFGPEGGRYGLEERGYPSLDRGYTPDSRSYPRYSPTRLEFLQGPEWHGSYNPRESDMDRYSTPQDLYQGLDPDPVRRLSNLRKKLDTFSEALKRREQALINQPPVVFDYSHKDAKGKEVQPSKTERWENDIKNILGESRPKAAPDSLALLSSAYSSPESSPERPAETFPAKPLPFSKSYLDRLQRPAKAESSGRGGRQPPFHHGQERSRERHPISSRPAREGRLESFRRSRSPQDRKSDERARRERFNRERREQEDKAKLLAGYRGEAVSNQQARRSPPCDSGSAKPGTSKAGDNEEKQADFIANMLLTMTKKLGASLSPESALKALLTNSEVASTLLKMKSDGDGKKQKSRSSSSSGNSDDGKKLSRRRSPVQSGRWSSRRNRQSRDRSPRRSRDWSPRRSRNWSPRRSRNQYWRSRDQYWRSRDQTKRRSRDKSPFARTSERSLPSKTREGSPPSSSKGNSSTSQSAKGGPPSASVTVTKQPSPPPREKVTFSLGKVSATNFKSSLPSDFADFADEDGEGKQ